MKINKILIICLAVAMSVPGFAQENAGTVLSHIEKNNTALQALRKRTEADQYGYKAERALEAPEVGFD